MDNFILVAIFLMSQFFTFLLVVFLLLGAYRFFSSLIDKYKVKKEERDVR